MLAFPLSKSRLLDHVLTQSQVRGSGNCMDWAGSKALNMV